MVSNVSIFGSPFWISNLLRSDEEFNKFIEQFDGEISNNRKRVLTNFPDSIIDLTVGYRDPIDNQNIK